MDENELKDINGNPLPRLDSTCRAEAHYLVAILRELQGLRKNLLKPDPSSSAKVEQG